ncbi:Cathepsin L [Papilio xuthus]|uniref:Cathepsin L n=1 Tax=Papilio xuthus TaxID=66420 RepID=A0A194QE39_PAPXU|nr:Cathepsin L [Papilio xuthus]
MAALSTVAPLDSSGCFVCSKCRTRVMQNITFKIAERKRIPREGAASAADADGAAEESESVPVAPMRKHASVWTPKVQDYVPQSVDWRKRGAVSAVKWQGQCDSSYAFAAAGALEGLLYTLTGQFIPLSVQNLVDCSVDYHNHGCAGGTIEKALQYVAANEGINTERDYKYEARTKPCRFNRSALMLVSVGYSSLINGDELALKRVVAKQPVAARLRVCFYDFFFYKSGIYSDNCPEENRMTVSVLIVGYGIQGSEKYWLLKNSWGTQWGTAGYMRLARNKGNQCGIAADLNAGGGGGLRGAGGRNAAPPAPPTPVGRPAPPTPPAPPPTPEPLTDAGKRLRNIRYIMIVIDYEIFSQHSEWTRKVFVL